LHLLHPRVLLADPAASRVWDLPRVLFGDVLAAAHRLHVNVFLRHHAAGGVRDLTDVLLTHHAAGLPGFHPRVPLSLHTAGRVVLRPHHRVADRAASGDRNLVEMFLGDIVTGPHRAHFFLRHPDLAADRPVRALHLLRNDFARATNRGAGARVVD